MKSRKASETNDPKISHPAPQLVYKQKLVSSSTDMTKNDLVHKFSNSFNSNSDFHNLIEKPQIHDVDSNPTACENEFMMDVSIEPRKSGSYQSNTGPHSQRFDSNEIKLTDEEVIICQSQPEIYVSEQFPLSQPSNEILTHGITLMSPECKTEQKKKTNYEKLGGNSLLNMSHLDDYIKNHPMKLNIQENFDKTFKILDKNSTNYQNNFMKQKMSIIKNMETKVHKPDAPILSKNPSQQNPGAPILPKIDKYSRASTKQKTNHSTSENKTTVTKFGVFNKADEQIFKKKEEKKTFDVEEPKKKVKTEYDFNHVFKILDFLDKDKSLKMSRKKIQDKMKDLGRESFNETNRKNVHLEQINETNFLKEYKIKHVLGKGSYGEVKLCLHEKSGSMYAVKIYPKKFLKDKIKKQNLQNEKDILLQIDHDNIIKLFKIVDGASYIYLLTEYAGKSSLHEVLTNSTKTMFSEEEARPIMWQLCQAIIYLHEEGIIHRDIKLHNILVNDHNILKLIDFGFALKMKEDDLIQVFCGTPSYMSPEIVNRTPYDGKASDVWAFGVCIYRMVIGTFPFRGILISIN